MKQIYITIFLPFILLTPIFAKVIEDDQFLSYNAIDRFNQAVNKEQILSGVSNIIHEKANLERIPQKKEAKSYNDTSEHISNDKVIIPKENEVLSDITLTISYKDTTLEDIARLLSNITESNISVDSKIKDQKVNLSAKKIQGNHLLKHLSKSTTPKSDVKTKHGITKIKPKSNKEKSEKKTDIKNKSEKNNNSQPKENNKNQSKSFNNGVNQKIIDIKHSTTDKDFIQRAESAWKNISGGSSNSHILINPETKKIFLRGNKNSIKEFTNFIESIDQPVPRVKIDVMLVLTDKQYGLDLGINWSGIYNRQDTIKAQNKNFGFTGIGGRLNDFPTPTSSTDPNNSNLLVNPANLAINLFTKALDTLSGFANLPIVFGGPDLNLRRLNLVLNASENDQRTKIIARPSVLTTNNQVAKILVGQSIPIYTAVQDVSQGSIRTMSKLTYKEIGVSMQVLPTISSDKKSISIDIFLETSEITSGSATYNSQGIAENPPQLLILKIKNNVVVENGQTTVIGGLINKKTQEIKNKVPLINKLPYIGALFRSRSNSFTESEDFIFITPSIVE